MCFELCCLLDYHPPVVVRSHEIPAITQKRVIPGYGRFFNSYHPPVITPLSGHRFGPYSGPRDLHHGRTFMGPAIAPGLNSRVTTSPPFPLSRSVGHIPHVPLVPTVNARAISGYDKGVINVRRT